ncbi:MAG TPA: secretin N-terminal domain-containing protein [Thermoanaerobaculia bacterium]
MKTLRIVLTVFLLVLPALAQESAKRTEDDANENRSFKNRIFEVQNRNPNDLASAIKLLGSGFKGAGISINPQLHTITVRDFPENIAAIEEALKRLDKPESSPTVVLNLAVLIGSKTPLPNAPAIPDELAAVIKQLQSTLRYSHYGVLTATMHHARLGASIENSGVAEPALVGMTAKEGNPVFYSYRLQQISAGDKTLNVERFSFEMRIPLQVGDKGVQYQNVGFNTPLSIRQNEKVVVGTTTMGDKALIVVLTATIEPQ